MKNLRDILIVTALGVTLFFPADANGELFKKRKARKAAKRGQSEVCVGPTCTQPVNTGFLRTNKKGGFEGQLPDSYYADYFAQRTPAATPEPTPAEVPEEASEEISIVVSSAGSVADTQAAVRQAEMSVVDAKAAAEWAVLEQQQADAKEVLELQQQIDDLTARLEALQPD